MSAYCSSFDMDHETVENPVSPGKIKSICSAEALDIAPHSNETFPQDHVNVDGISIYYHNVRGLRTKIDHVYTSVCDSEQDVVILTETWLNDISIPVNCLGANTVFIALIVILLLQARCVVVEYLLQSLTASALQN